MDPDFELAVKLSLELNDGIPSDSTRNVGGSDNLKCSADNCGGLRKRSRDINDYCEPYKKPALSKEDEDYQLALKLSEEINKQPPPSVIDNDYFLALKLSKQNDSPDVVEVKSDDESDDFLLAIKLSEKDFQPDVINGKPGKSSSSTGGRNVKNYEDDSISVVDPSWETIDPNPDIYGLFAAFNKRFFWGKLDCVEVKWSPRMTQCAGVCSYSSRAGFCSVRLSQPLLRYRPRKDLVETLLHEMIHAFLFVTRNDRDRDGHGPQFHKHMNRINKDSGAHITVYHSFHEEVKHYKTHWWKCNGPCQHKAPYYGFVKRSMNRAPGPNDTWWNDHRATCGGSFVKVKEPEDYVNKKKKDNSKATPNRIDNYFLPQASTSSSKMENSSTNSTSNKSSTLDSMAVTKFPHSGNTSKLVNKPNYNRSKHILSLVDINANKSKSEQNSKSPEKSRWAPLPGQKNIFHFINKS